MTLSKPNPIDVIAAGMVAAFALGYTGRSPLFALMAMTITVAVVFASLAPDDDELAEDKV